jgi:hypothetical protein
LELLGITWETEIARTYLKQTIGNSRNCVCKLKNTSQRNNQYRISTNVSFPHRKLGKVAKNLTTTSKDEHNIPMVKERWHISSFEKAGIHQLT